MSERNQPAPVAWIVGTGEGLGYALARCFSRAGMKVAISARNAGALQGLAERLAGEGHEVLACPCDATNESQVITVIQRIGTRLGMPDLVIYNAGAYIPGRITETSVETFESCWRVGCLGGFIVGRESARYMLEKGSGTILFTGATASLRGGAGFANLAVGKFGLRALSQSMARELGPQGIHIAHVIIDGQILSERYAHLAAGRPEHGLLEPDAIAANYLHLFRQPRSSWSQEMDLRPWCEKF